VFVLQGNVATKLSYSGKFFILVMSHFFLIPTLKEFKKSTNICQSYSKNKSGPVFLTHNVVSEMFSIKFAGKQTDTSTDNKGRLMLAAREPTNEIVITTAPLVHGQCRSLINF